MTYIAHAPMSTGLTTVEHLAVQTLYRAFSEGNPDLLDQVVTPEETAR